MNIVETSVKCAEDVEHVLAKIDEAQVQELRSAILSAKKV